MKREVKIRKCRKCGQAMWEKTQTVTTSYVFHERWKSFVEKIDNDEIVKTVESTWFECTACHARTKSDPIEITIIPEYSEFEQNGDGRLLKTKVHSTSDTELIKWSYKEIDGEFRPYNSYVIVRNEKGPWRDKYNNRVRLYSINGIGEIRWEVTSYSGNADEYSVMKKFELVWTEGEKPYWLEQEEKRRRDLGLEF